MIGIDTNVLLRYVLRDDPQQWRLAAACIHRCSAADPGRVDDVVLCEVVWVLDRSLRMTRQAIADTLEKLLQADELLFPRRDLAVRAVARYRASKADFADCLIGLLNVAAGCTGTMTFDREAASLPEFTAL